MTDKTPKVTRRMFVEAAVACDTSKLCLEEYQNVGKKMLASFDKQANRPKSKSAARIKNEGHAKELIRLLFAPENMDELINATWISQRIKWVDSSQKAAKVADIAIEWGAAKKIYVKNRAYYIPVLSWEPPKEWNWDDWQIIQETE